MCIIHFFLLHEISPLHTCKKNGIVLTTPPRAEKNCYIRVRNDNSMMPIVTRACFFMHEHVHKKIAYWAWSWHLFRSPWSSFRMLAFLCTALIFQELMKKRSLKKVFCLLFCACAQFAFSSGTFVPFTPCYVRVSNGIMFTLCYVRVSV